MKIEVTRLAKLPNEKGKVYHGIKKSELCDMNMSEVYFSEIYYKNVKGWKLHKRMVMNLIVVFGQVRFFIYNQSSEEKYTVEAGENNYIRLKVPPMHWVAFEGMHERNIICNIASIDHDPEEQINIPIDTYDLKSTDFIAII